MCLKLGHKCISSRQAHDYVAMGQYCGCGAIKASSFHIPDAINDCKLGAAASPKSQTPYIANWVIEHCAILRMHCIYVPENQLDQQTTAVSPSWIYTAYIEEIPWGKQAARLVNYLTESCPKGSRWTLCFTTTHWQHGGWRNPGWKLCIQNGPESAFDGCT